MLVLSRRRDESIILGDNIEIMIVGIQPNRIKLGITAPKGLKVYRREIYEHICEEKNAGRNTKLMFHPRHKGEIFVET